MHRQAILSVALLCGSLVGAAETRVPQWDARGVGLWPAQGIACLDVSGDGAQIVVGTIAFPGDPNVHVLDAEGKIVRSHRVGQRWIAQVVAGEQPWALCTMTTGSAFDEPLVFRCGEAPAAVAGGNGGMSLFHYGDHSNHIGKQLVAYPGGAVTLNENQLLWLAPTTAPEANAPPAATPRATAVFRNLKPTALAVHPSGAAIVGGYVDGPAPGEPANLFVYRPGAMQAEWGRPVVADVGASQPPERGEYGNPILADGTRHPLPQRDDPMFAPLSIAVSREAEFSEATRIAAADYRGWQRWIRSSATGQEEQYGTRFMPAKPAVTVYDGAGRLVRRFDPEKFAHAGWVDLAFLPGAAKLIAYPHSWTCRGLAGQSILPADEPAATLYVLDVASGEVRSREFPDAVASVAVSDRGTVVVACWNGRVYKLDQAALVDGPLPAGTDVGHPALVKLLPDDGLVAATTAGEVLLISPTGEVRRSVDLNQAVPRTEKSWVQNMRAQPLAKGLWELPGGRVESDLGGQRIVEAPDGLILIEGHAGLTFEGEWAAIERAGLDPRRIKYILATHEHGDHAPGAAQWRVATGAQFVCSRQMAYTLQHHLPNGTGYGLHPPVATDIKLDDDDTLLELAGLKIGALRLPGHTYGSMGWLLDREGKKFVAIGDLIMPEGRLGYAGSINFSPFQVLESLRKLDGLGVDLILPGHGPVVGPEKYVAAGIAIGSRVGWGKMTPEKPDPRFAISHDNVLIAGFLSGATSTDFGDLDGDGLPDAAVVAPRGEGSVVKIFYNRADRPRRFDPMQPDVEIAVPTVGTPSRLRTLALNSDRRTDVFVSGQAIAGLLTSREAPGEFEVRTVPSHEVHQLRMLAADAGDRLPVLMGRFSAAAAVVPGRDNRLDTKTLAPQVQAAYSDVRELDLNGDGRTDWLVNNGRVWLRDDQGRIPETATMQLPLPVADDWCFTNVGDVNGDRRPDAVLVSYGMQQVRRVAVHHNTGNAAAPFAVKPDLTFEIKSMNPHLRDAPPLADWDGDGAADLFIGLGQDNQVRIYRGSPTGLSEDRLETLTLDYWLHYEHPLTVADFNADGRPDLAAFAYTQTGVGLSGPPAAYIWLQKR